MNNPFEPINARLSNLEALSLELLQLLRNTASRTTTDIDELLTPEEAAKFLKISKVSLWSWEKKGIIKGRHIGNLKRFSRNDLLAIGTKKGGVSA
jgi:hypothetical protein